MTGNVELAPVWKDCTDSDEDKKCDECGYILVKSELPGEENNTVTDDQKNTDPTDGQDADHEGMPSWSIGIIAGGGSAVGGT